MLSQCGQRQCTAQRSDFFGGARLRQSVSNKVHRQQRLEVQNFKFMKKLGLKKPEFLPDFGLEKRKVLLTTLFTSFDGTLLNPVLDDSLKLSGAGKHVQSKQDYVTVLGHLKRAVPDFEWNHETTGSKDEAGYVTVEFQGSGKFDGEPFAPPKTPPVEPHGKSVTVPQQTARVLVEDGVAKEIEFADGFLDKVYTGLGGKIPLAK